MTDEEKLEFENALLALQEQVAYIYDLAIKLTQPRERLIYGGATIEEQV